MTFKIVHFEYHTGRKIYFIKRKYWLGWFRWGKDAFIFSNRAWENPYDATSYIHNNITKDKKLKIIL